MKSYSELSTLNSFEDRFNYLKLRGGVGIATLGFDRYLGQMFYSSKEWRDIRVEVILRDRGLDLGSDGYDIHGRVLIHHMNPITVEDLKQNLDVILNPEYLVMTTHSTHNAIHYGDFDLIPKPYVPRRKDDTKLW